MIHDFTDVQALKSFPWESVFVGLAKSKKTVTTFYGDVHSTKYVSEADSRWVDKDQWRWYNAFKFGVDVEGFNVNLNRSPGNQFWWARNHEPGWIDTDNMALFSDLQTWIRSSQIFKHTGRQLFFIQLANQGSPVHTDFDPAAVPSHLREPSEFIWLTPPSRPKSLAVGGVDAPWCCWFNHFVPHGSSPEKDTRWSLRIDGVFTDQFREQHCAS